MSSFATEGCAPIWKLKQSAGARHVEDITVMDRPCSVADYLTESIRGGTPPANKLIGFVQISRVVLETSGGGVQTPSGLVTGRR